MRQRSLIGCKARASLPGLIVDEPRNMSACGASHTSVEAEALIARTAYSFANLERRTIAK